MENRVNVVGAARLNLASAVCALCLKPVSEHIAEDGFRCSAPAVEHPLRRESDGDVTFVPLRNVIASADKRSRNTGPRRARKSRQSRVKEERRAAGNTDTSAQRGRTPGRYAFNMKADLSKLKLTDSVGKVARMLKTKGATGAGLHDISRKLDMPTGTVGWALQKLAKQNAVSRIQPANA